MKIDNHILATILITIILIVPNIASAFAGMGSGGSGSSSGDTYGTFSVIVDNTISLPSGKFDVYRFSVSSDGGHVTGTFTSYCDCDVKYSGIQVLVLNEEGFTNVQNQIMFPGSNTSGDAGDVYYNSMYTISGSIDLYLQNGNYVLMFANDARSGMPSNYDKTVTAKVNLKYTQLITPTPSPIITTPTPSPIITTTTPSPIIITPTPSPIIITPTPSPIIITPTPSPIIITPTPSPVIITPTPSPVIITPTPSPVIITPTPSPIIIAEEKFRVGPTVNLRPVNDDISISEDGLIELYMDNPSINDVVMNTDIRISVPSGISVYGQGFGDAGSAGVLRGTFDIPPGQSRTIQMTVKAERTGEFLIKFSGLYWPGDDKDVYEPISLTHNFKVHEDIKTPIHTETKIIPGFEIIMSMIILLSIRKNMR